MKKVILLADDSVTIQKVIELTFMDGDFQVVAVSSGTEAIDRMEEVAPDLVIADVHMPGATGYEVCRAAKSHRAGMPVLLLVGMFEPYDEAQAEQAGAEAHLKKPFDSQELLDLVGRLWTEWQAGEDAGTGGAAATGLATAQVPAMETADAADGPRVASFDGDATSAFESSDLSLSVTRDLSPSQGAAAEDAAAPVWGNLDIDAAAEADSGGDSSDDDGTAGIDPEQPFGAMAASSAGASAADGDDEPFGSVASFGAAAPAADDDDEHEEPVASMAADDAGDDSDHEDSQAVAVADAQEADAEEAGGQEAGAQEASAQEASAGVGSLSEEEVDRIARRVVELLGDRPVREVAWEVVPDLAEVVIKERIRELEAQVEN